MYWENWMKRPEIFLVVSIVVVLYLKKLLTSHILVSRKFTQKLEVWNKLLLIQNLCSKGLRVLITVTLLLEEGMRTRLHHWCSISCSLPIRTRMLRKKKKERKKETYPTRKLMRDSCWSSSGVSQENWFESPRLTDKLEKDVFFVSSRARRFHKFHCHGNNYKRAFLKIDKWIKG